MNEQLNGLTKEIDLERIIQTFQESNLNESIRQIEELGFFETFAKAGYLMQKILLETHRRTREIPLLAKFTRIIVFRYEYARKFLNVQIYFELLILTKATISDLGADYFNCEMLYLFLLYKMDVIDIEHWSYYVLSKRQYIYFKDLDDQQTIICDNNFGFALARWFFDIFRKKEESIYTWPTWRDYSANIYRFHGDLYDPLISEPSYSEYRLGGNLAPNNIENIIYHEVTKIIEKDNIEYLRDKSSFDFDFNNIPHITNEWEPDLLLLEPHSYIEHAAFFGSTKCFKFLLLNNCNITDNLIKYAVAGGNTEIIRLVQTNKEFQGKFADTFEISICYHRYEVSIWLFDTFPESYNYNLENVLPFVAKYDDVDMFKYFIDRKCPLNYEKCLLITYQYGAMTIKRVLNNMKEFNEIDFVKLFGWDNVLDPKYKNRFSRKILDNLKNLQEEHKSKSV